MTEKKALAPWSASACLSDSSVRRGCSGNTDQHCCRAEPEKGQGEDPFKSSTLKLIPALLAWVLNSLLPLLSLGQ